ncbi:SDR family oxidoreductase [Candidatus Sulfidibacterium hydrothermale]|jgi:NAD(P)-dependent dehydrogenase (short-subunit alcohol dehydrogenase family)|uniref:SDR family oxidoreductase n=1 Tax=Candidatus Sulfidibacterium hydrothermale TaxID=2875962 RepID=UPI001F0A0929|nr:SDR family oxidoreductase [Candidatus Sulfidibacterium hydrothermale]UBM61263.1 SDR family oxidoreductase [Candidatus Sulfidibacterium hydrothermale]
MNKFSFQDKVVAITGASSGIGKELAVRLAEQGAWLALGARNLEKQEETAALCRQKGGKALALQLDVAQKESCRNFIEKTVAEYGRIDVLVNNAGISMWAYFEEFTDVTPFEEIMKVNYFGSLYCTFYALPYLKKTKGRLVGVSSLTGKTGVPTRSGYAASKHAMAGFFDTLRIELKDTGVSVTMIYPGFVATEVRKRAFGADGKSLDESPLDESTTMTVEKCVSLMIPAIAKRKREVVMTTKAKIGLWLKLLAPGLVDKIALKAVSKGKK